MFKHTLGLLLALFLTVGGAYGHAASPPLDSSGTEEIAFSEDILPLLQEKFAPLLKDEKGLRLDSWAHLLEGSAYGEVLIPYDANNSLLIELATKSEGTGAPTAEEIDRVRQWIEAGAKNDAGEVPFEDAEELLYVCNQDAALVSVIDMETNQVVRTVDLQELGFSENAKPHHTVVEPDGSHWYLSLIGENKVLKFNRDNELVGEADFEVPGMLALDTTSSRLYVGRSMSAVNPPTRIGVIDHDDMTTLEEIEVSFPRPHALTVDPEGQYVYSASLAQNQIATVETETERVNLTSLGGPTHTLVQFAFDPAGGTMVAGGQVSGQFFFFDTSTPSAPAVTDTLRVNAEPWHPVYTPDGRHIYVGNKGAHTVTVIDAENRTIEAVIEGKGLAQPHGSAIRPDGRYVYISNNNLDGTYEPRHASGANDETGTVVVIDTETQEIAKVIEVGAYATGLGTRPALQ